MESPMKRLIVSLSLILTVASGTGFAQLRAPDRVLQQVVDPSMVIIDRGAKLEIFPMKRALPQSDATGRVILQQVVAESANSMIGPTRLGVVFNHAMQQLGYVSGEIAFQMKPGLKLSGLSSALYPGLKKITNPQVYVVNARTPAEFIAVLKRLQARDDLAWIEPTVTYGPSQQTVTNSSTQ